MSEGQFAKTTRRSFLGTATVATAATLAVPVGGAAHNASSGNSAGLTKVAAVNNANENLMAAAKASDWTKPAAMAIPKEGYFKLEQGRYGPLFPKTPANYGFTIIAKIKPGREETIRQYGKTIENAVAGDPSVLAPLRLHYLRWVLFNIGERHLFHVPGNISTLISTSTPKTPSPYSQRLGSTQSSKISKVSQWIGKRTLRHSLNLCANTNVRVFWNTASIRS